MKNIANTELKENDILDGSPYQDSTEGKEYLKMTAINYSENMSDYYEG